MRKRKSLASTEPLPSDAPILWKPSVVSKILHRSEMSLARDRMLNRGAKWVRCGRHILYPRESVLAYLKTCDGTANTTEGR